MARSASAGGPVGRRSERDAGRRDETERGDPGILSHALKIGEVARAAGVPVATVKFYLREGLLPPPVASGRNIAYYPAEAVERIRLVKELQEKRFLPLRVIRALVSPREEGAAGSGTTPADLRGALSAAAELALAGIAAPAPEGGAGGAGRAALSRAERAALLEAGILGGEGDPSIPAIDARILRVIGDLRRAGFTRGRGFTADRLLLYQGAARALAAEELELVISLVLRRVGAAEAPAMLSAAIDLCGELLVLLRRKALLAAIAGISRAAGDGPARAAGRGAGAARPTRRGGGGGRRAGRRPGRSAS
jgi:DNA-binding transcriptional MerR regulator